MDGCQLRPPPLVRSQRYVLPDPTKREPRRPCKQCHHALHQDVGEATSSRGPTLRHHGHATNVAGACLGPSRSLAHMATTSAARKSAVEHRAAIQSRSMEEGQAERQDDLVGYLDGILART